MEKIQEIVRALSFSGEWDHFPASFSIGGMREWRRVMKWLDCSGLALYFLQKLEKNKMHGAVPAHVLQELKCRQCKNRQRMTVIRSRFNSINREFSRAGIEYVVEKGFSLLPEYCPDESLRIQSDLDYLVPLDSQGAATRILIEQGYSFKKRHGQESVFWIPAKEPLSSAEQYDVNMPCVIELHVTIWDENRFLVPLQVPQITSAQAKTRQWRDCNFPALPEPQIFLHQILHLFQHVITGKVRLCHFFEMAYFLNQSVGMTSFWTEIERLCSDVVFREILGLVSAMALTVFPGGRAAIITRCTNELNPVARLWIENYSRSWLIEGAGEAIRFFSSAKLVLFLQELYILDVKRASLRLRSMIPLSGLRRLTEPMTVSATHSKRRWRNYALMLSRVFYHIGSNFRYLYEVQHWCRITAMLRNHAR
jgi:hypothetical protein